MESIKSRPNLDIFLCLERNRPHTTLLATFFSRMKSKTEGIGVHEQNLDLCTTMSGHVRKDGGTEGDERSAGGGFKGGGGSVHGRRGRRLRVFGRRHFVSRGGVGGCRSIVVVGEEEAAATATASKRTLCGKMKLAARARVKSLPSFLHSIHLFLASQWLYLKK